MKDDRLTMGNLGVLTMQGLSLPPNVDKICKKFVTKHTYIIEKCVLQLMFICMHVTIYSYHLPGQYFETALVEKRL